ncbi:MAG: hypothetical protein B0D92_04785 [Spirochaeta sp. LUC14_002_19_P3]|nr:MAG: hypothetical protein B0D92_04785 [Spirochaeta sp. LUC14_002_19_P3]
MMISNNTYNLKFDPVDQEICFSGNLRVNKVAELEKIYDFMEKVHDSMEGVMRLNFRRMKYVDANGLQAIMLFLKYAKAKDKLDIKLIVSNVLTWAEKTLYSFSKISDRIEFVIHDQNFYGSQSIIEDQDFIPLLRNQTKLLWPLEREVLIKHGLAKGMRVADICSGCGDTSLLVARELNPSMIVGVDHSTAGVGFAMERQNEFKVRNAEFRLGDASSLMLEDNSFDFVICRLSIQIFSKPMDIMRELYRITKTGGRIYVTGEDYDMIVGSPHQEEIRNVYNMAGGYGTDMGMDLYNGRKLYSMLRDMKLSDIRTDHIVVDTVNSDRDAFAEMVESWKHFSAETISSELNLDQSTKTKLLAGYDTHLKAIKYPHGYSTWTVVAASGEKKSA